MDDSLFCKACGAINPSSNSSCCVCGLPLNTMYGKVDDTGRLSPISTTVYGVEINTTDFEKAKFELNNILLACTETNPQLDKVATSGGLFNLFNHTVTGEEMNNLTAQIQEYLISLNSFDGKIITQLGKIYNTFDALDEKYIQKIVITLQCAEKASNEAKKAGVDALKALKETKKTVTDLSNTQKSLQSAQTSLRCTNEKIDKTVNQLGKTIQALSKLKSKVDEVQHLKDIDMLWEDYQSSKTFISELNRKTQSVRDKLEKYSQEIENLLQWKNALEEFDHIMDIDYIWNKCVETEKQLSNAELTISNQQNEINTLKAELSEIQHENATKMPVNQKLAFAFALGGVSLCTALTALILLFLR